MIGALSHVAIFGVLIGCSDRRFWLQPVRHADSMELPSPLSVSTSLQRFSAFFYQEYVRVLREAIYAKEFGVTKQIDA